MKKAIKIVAWLSGGIVLILFGLAIYVRAVATIDVPRTPEIPSHELMQGDAGFSSYGRNWFRKSESGLYELYVEGSPYERGVAAGKLTKELVRYQEDVFNQQIRQLVPSSAYLNVLKYLVGWFNRNLDQGITEEYRQEIYGIAQAASHDYDDIAPPYQRILNYHAAHDIGHALQNMSLVGCTAFGTWDTRSADSALIIGRNFDFYVGDDFAKNKIVAFYRPEDGYPFMMVTFGGMAGVLSGMNAEGLTVTINAAKSEIPSASATPVSLVAREILQYASTIQEAYAIAEKRKTFVAEAFLIGSARDGSAAIIEKSPDAIDLFRAREDYIIGTNHFQGSTLGGTELNRTHMKNSASVYRYERVGELLDSIGRNSVELTARILRDRKGKGGRSIGLGNEKSINQLIAHHAVIFEPEKKLVWVSTAPWQLGKFVCYDLNRIFTDGPSGEAHYRGDLSIGADLFLSDPRFGNALKFHPYRFPFQPRTGVDPDSLVKWNPDSYLSYMLAGDHCFQRDEFAAARAYYEQGLKKEIATGQEKAHMEKNLKRCIEELQ